MFTTTRGLVLREVNYKEADKILTVLTDTEGKLTVSARRARRKSCQYAAASQFLAYSEMTLFGNRGRWSLNEAETVEQFLGLREDISKLALAAYFAELLEAVSDEDEPNPQLLQLGLNSLYALSRDLCPEKQLKAAFELRLMCLSGYAPDVSACAACGREQPEKPVLDLQGGCLCCGGCMGAGRAALLCPDSLAAVRHVVSSPARRIFSFTLGGDALDRLSRAAEEYLLYHMDRGFSSLDYFTSLK